MNALALLLPSLLAAGQVSEVVVFPDRAQVVRSAQVACGPRAQVSFTDVSPAADPQSFRARTSAGTVEGLRSVERTREQAFAPKLKDLEQQLLEVNRQIQAQRDVQARAATQSKVGQQLADTTVQFVNRELVEQPANAKTWIQALDAAQAARLKAAAQTQEAAAKIRTLEQKRSDLLRRQQLLMSTPQRHDYTVDVLVSCPSGTATVQLTYLVGGASWEPSYELRAAENGSVELTTLAEVSQTTGEPWAGAKLTLSTAVPRQNATPPEIQQLKVYAQERQEQKKVLVRRDEAVEHAQAPGGGAPAGGQGRLSAEEQGLSVQLKVPEAVDVPADGSPVRLQISTHTLKAQWSNRTVPKLQPYVFRVAELVNSAPFPLLAGPLSVFHRGGFIGTVPLERVPQGGRMTVTFGAEDGFKVKRIPVKEVQKDTGFLGTTRRFHYAYRLELSSYRPGTEELQVQEHIPVSELDDVHVEIDPKTTGGYELEKSDGIVTWKLKIPKGETKNVDLIFHVDVPSSYDNGNL
jgi:uncharacterized protein (TIGR02231 family)